MKKISGLVLYSLVFSLPTLAWILAWIVDSLDTNYGIDLGWSSFFFFIPAIALAPAVIISAPFALAFGIIAFRRAYKNPNASRPEYILSAVGALLGLITTGYIILYSLSGIL